MNECGSWPFAASTVFSLFGLLYVAIPVVVPLLAAWFASRTSRHLFWAIVFDATAAVLGLFAAIPVLAVVAHLSGERPQVLIDRHLAVAANVGACLGAAVGVVASLVRVQPPAHSRGADREHRMLVRRRSAS